MARKYQAISKQLLTIKFAKSTYQTGDFTFPKPMDSYGICCTKIAVPWYDYQDMHWIIQA